MLSVLSLDVHGVVVHPMYRDDEDDGGEGRDQHSPARQALLVLDGVVCKPGGCTYGSGPCTYACTHQKKRLPGAGCREATRYHAGTAPRRVAARARPQRGRRPSRQPRCAVPEVASMAAPC